MSRRGGPRIPIATEYQEQKILCQWLDLYGITYAAVQNAARRSPKLAARLKATGLKAGFPDLLIFEMPPTDRATHRPERKGVAIELKRSKGGRVSPKQDEWVNKLRTLGWEVLIANGASDALSKLSDLGYGTPRG